MWKITIIRVCESTSYKKQLTIKSLYILVHEPLLFGIFYRYHLHNNNTKIRCGWTISFSRRMGRPDKEAFDDMEITLDYIKLRTVRCFANKKIR